MANFDLNLVSIILNVDNAPIDISAGLVIESDFLKVSKKTKEETKNRKGTKGTNYTAMSVEDSNRKIELVYLPDSIPVKILQGLRESKKTFGMFIKNDSAPKYTLTANECNVVEEPDTVVNGKDGFKDYTFIIDAIDSKQLWG